jgi:hypothetical protein
MAFGSNVMILRAFLRLLGQQTMAFDNALVPLDDDV